MRWFACVMLVLLGSMVACRPAEVTQPVATRSGVASDTPEPGATLPPTPTQWPTPVNHPWRTLARGVEHRDLDAPAEFFRFPATAVMVRLDPSLVKIHTHYSPEVPITIEDWQRETRAMVVVNGGFFTPAKRIDGLMVSFGQPYGLSYREGGMFYIRNGQPGLRDLALEGYDEDEEFEEAMQAYPVLVGADGRAAVPFDDERYNRRTAVGVDSLGRVLLIVFDEPVISLYELSRWLAADDLDIVMALNLDGGSSTGLAVATESEQLLIDSGGPVPIVIAAYP